MADIEDLQPCVAMTSPIAVKDLVPGETKYWCQCGLSKSQPWCDGSHKGTGITPMAWKVPEGEAKTYYLCACKHTGNKPLCDGSHKKALENVHARAAACAHKDQHKDGVLCTKCGYHSNQAKA